MKKIFFLMLMLLILSSASMNAQVNIGSANDPHKGAILDLSQSELNLGLLFPKVYLFSTHDFTLPVDEGVDAIGMVIYNNNASLPDGRGLYSWNGTEWKSMSSSTANSCIPVTATATSAKEGNNAKITVNVTAGNPTYTYVWSKGASVVRTTANTTATSDTYTTTGEDTYTVTVTNPCTATPVSFTFIVAGDGGTLKENGNGTQTDEEGNLIYNDETYAPVESDIPGIYLDEGGEIVYTGADGIPGTADDDVFVTSDYPLPTQEILFSVKYPVRILQGGKYQIELDFADGTSNYTGKIKYISTNPNVISINNEGLLTAGTAWLLASFAVVLEDGSIFRTGDFTIYPTIITEDHKLNKVLNNEIVLNESSVKKISAGVIDNSGSLAYNIRSMTYAIADANGTGSTVTSGGWFRAGTPGVVTVIATATDNEENEFTGTIIVTILGNPSPEVTYETVSTNWANLEPAPAYAGGDGTMSNPYLISSVRQFKKLSVDITILGATEATYQKYFELTADLDFSGDETVTGTLISDFYGNLNGKGHLIKNLNIDASGRDGVALFGTVSYGEIKNIGREGGATTGTDAKGIYGFVAALNNGGKISNCYNSSDIDAMRIVGGFGGYISSGAVLENCYNTGNVIAHGATNGTLVGGFVAVNNVGGTTTIINCYNSGNIEGLNTVGGLGLVDTAGGQKQNLNMSNCFNFGEVVVTQNTTVAGSIISRIVSTSASLVEINATNVYSKPDVVSVNGETKSNQPIGWSGAAGSDFKDAVLFANPTLKEDAKYSLEYSQSAAFVTELGNAFKFANGRTPKLAWEK